ncbi:hypothetical protein D0Z08_18405 [Nocardioides immobilis]|uniref:CoA carboxyltransferase C-terminal domain-containing protein n=1 Tax=Nocardioides immobilis TaxID=2049295 RepID=A0A417XZD6_9ACTN|nr:hypothetical protein D0Z08_18405 [Nocardioides immobilis]
MSLALGAATVPTFTVLVRKGYGGGYVIMSGGRTFHPTLVLAWPDAETGVMSPDAALDLVFRRELESAEDPAAAREQLARSFSDRLGAVRGAEGFGFDAVVRPSETRQLLVDTLATLPRRKLMQHVTPRVHPVDPL